MKPRVPNYGLALPAPVALSRHGAARKGMFNSSYKSAACAQASALTWSAKP